MKGDKIEVIEAIAFLVIITINGIMLSTSQYIVNSCMSSSLINTIYISIIILLITGIICYLTKAFRGNNILDISEFLGGKVLKFIVGIAFIGYFAFRATILLRKITSCLQIVYYPMTNVIFIIALFCITTGIIASLKNNSIFKSFVILFPILFLAVILVFVGNTKNFYYENVFPILGNGINSTFFSGISNMFAFSGLGYLLFIPSKLKKPEKFTKIALLSMTLSTIFLLVSVASILLLYNDTLTNLQLFPLYISVRYIEFGIFFQRLDSLFLFLFILGSIAAISANTYIIINIFREICNLSDSKPLVYPYSVCILGLTLLISKTSTLELLENIVAKTLFISFSIVIPALILITANIKKCKTSEVVK